MYQVVSGVSVKTIDVINNGATKFMRSNSLFNEIFFIVDYKSLQRSFGN